MRTFWIVDGRGLFLATVVGRFRDDEHGRVYRRVWRWAREAHRQWSAETAATLIRHFDPEGRRGLRAVPVEPSEPSEPPPETR